MEETWDGLPLGPLPFEPGRAVWSAGGGMQIAGIALEHETGRPFVDAAHSLVLDPAGMTDATYEVGEPGREYAIGHDLGPVDTFFDCEVLDPTELFASISDLAAFASWLMVSGRRGHPRRQRREPFPSLDRPEHPRATDCGSTRRSTLGPATSTTGPVPRRKA